MSPGNSGHLLACLFRRALLFALVPACQAEENEDFWAAFDEAKTLAGQNDHVAAASEYQRALAIAERVFSERGVDLALVLNNLAYEYSELGRYTEAQPLYERAIKVREAALKPPANGRGQPAIVRRTAG
jgi:tetratricopeptide (TPR) repeat protein